ncbi:serine/threonine-protein kinase [Streptosporangium sp. DT93]|uniref:serine/threonine-protein kinase n=1 Tax=Streptosporangium sp. DT93 TaxID=3393428 RepID=UPI003CEDECB2
MNQPGVEGLRPADPEQIGSYRLLGRLGEGGMGTVYLALAPAGRPVALKVVKAEFAIEEGFASRFHAEVENARRVASFCTAQVLDNGTADDGRPYMVTEYIAGTPLSRQISGHGALEAGTLHGVALGVAAALAAIHVSGLVHRDLKPANVILSMSGPRVIDFGIARALDSTHSFTRSGEVLGSPGWWAPEQVRGLEITPAADIFAWGCLVAYAGNGRHPYGRGDLMTMATRLLNTPPDLGALPAPLNDLVRLATAMDPYRRPSAQDLLIALVGGQIAAPAAPAPLPADPPTLIATDLLNESWLPPSNVEPDSTQTLSALNLDAGFDDPATAPTPVPSRFTSRRPLPPARPPVPPPVTLPPATTPSASPTKPGTSGAPGTPPVAADPATAPAPASPPSSPATRVDSSTSPSYSFAGPFQNRAGEGSEGRSSTPPPRPSFPPAAGPDAPDGERAGSTGTAPRRRWLFAGLAALAALVVTVVVLLNTGTTRSGGTARGDLAGTAGTAVSDVGHRIATGARVKDPELIITRSPACELTSYQGTTPERGRFCTIPWTLVNTGGETVSLAPAPLTLQDDRGATHQAHRASTGLPSTLPPGARADGVLVYDLPPSRRPAKLTGVVIKGGSDVEVRFS